MQTHPLKVEREARGWSQAKVAETLGTTSRTVSRWEQGLAVPYPYYREQLSRLFGKSVRELGFAGETTEVVAATITPLATAEEGAAAEIPRLYDAIIPSALGSSSSSIGT